MTDIRNDDETLHLIDGSGFIFRAFHALPPLTRADGTPVNAVLGFTNMLVRLMSDVGAGSIAVIFDAKRANFRNEFYPEYKANRPPAPEELVPQFSLIREATEAFALPAIELEGFEADDLIATYAKLALEDGRRVVVVSSDKDLMQLVRPGVSLYDPIKNKPIGSEEVFEKFGVSPDKVVDVQALAGDATDNVPGVPGIGVKTAAQLITEYGDLDTLLARAGEIKQNARRQKLIENAELARISRRLVTLAENAPVPVPLSELSRREPDHGKLIDFLRAQGFRSLISKFENAAPALKPASATETPPAVPRLGPEVEKRYELIRDRATLDRWVERIKAAGRVAVDTETNGLTPALARLVGLSLATEPGLAAYLPLGHGAGAAGQLALDGETPRQLPVPEVMEALRDVLEDPSILKIGHNFKFDFQFFAREGVRPTPIDDTMLISYALDGGGRDHGMDALADKELGYTTIPFSDVCGTGKNQITFDRVPLDRALAYAAEDADVTLRLWLTLKPRLPLARMVTVYETIERPLVSVVADMESRGVRVDRAELARLSRDLGERLVELEAAVQKLAPRPFNVGSPKQLGEILFEDMGLEGGKKGKNGAWGTDSSVLEELAERGFEIAERVLDWRKLAKLKSTYTDALQECLGPDDRVHTSFSLAATNTGRLSSTDPNLQNIPVRSEEGRMIRRAFVAEKRFKLLSADYSQIELRLVADIANIAALKQAFHDGVDIHAATASQVFGVPLDRMTSDIRRKAKAINFGIIYGISGFGLGRQLGIPPGEANAFIRAYLERFHELKSWMETTKEFARKNGFVTTIFGRRCPIAGMTDRNPARRSFGERQAINAPIQGAAADIMRRAMSRVPAALKRASLSAAVLLQVHDELLLEVPEAEVEETTTVVRAAMEGAAALSVPLVAEAGVGDNWGDAH